MGMHNFFHLSFVIQIDVLASCHSTLYYFILFSNYVSTSKLSQLQQCLVPLKFHLPNVIIARDAMFSHLAFHDSDLPNHSAVPGQVVYVMFMWCHRNSWMLCTLAFHLSDKFGAVHLENSTAQAYLCNQDETLSLFLSTLACHIMNLADKHGTALIPAYILTHLNVEAISHKRHYF